MSEGADRRAQERERKRERERKEQENEIRELKDHMGELMSLVRTMKAKHDEELRERDRVITDLRAGSVARS